MSYEWVPSPNFKSGRTEAVKYIVIHHWDDPARKPKIEGVINRFKDPAIEIAAHYVVSGDRIVKMVEEKDTAWHARSANPFTIGIEVDPQVPGDTYETVGALVQDIRSRYGNLPLKRHCDFVNTTCPGELDLARIDKEASMQDKASQIAEIRLNHLRNIAKAAGVSTSLNEAEIAQQVAAKLQGLQGSLDKVTGIATIRGNLLKNLAKAEGLDENTPADQIISKVIAGNLTKEQILNYLLSNLK